MKISRNFIRKVYRLGIIDTRNYRYCFHERSMADGRFPAVVRFKRERPYENVEELTIYDVDILYNERDTEVEKIVDAILAK